MSVVFRRCAGLGVSAMSWARWGVGRCATVLVALALFWAQVAPLPAAAGVREEPRSVSPAASGEGCWLVAADGGIFAFGDATFHGSTGNIALTRPIVGMAPTPRPFGGPCDVICRVSVDSDGNQANRYSEDPAISAPGRYVAFVSLASNLVAGDTNNKGDVFVHDTLGG